MSVSGLRARVLVLAVALAAAFGTVAARLTWLQVVRHAELAALADRQYTRTVVLQAPRGPIVDRHGTVLAASTPAESLFVQPRSVGDPVRVAARLAPILGVPEGELHAALVAPRSFTWLRRRMPPAVAERVRALREPGLGLIAEPLRLYPNRELAAHVLGFEGVDGGLEGIERSREDTLAGVPGRAIVDRDALGRDVSTPHVLQAPVPGHGVMLTLDVNIQYAVERELDAAWRRTRARGAMAVVLDPRTGDVLASAVRPTFNPNTFLDVRDGEVWRNRVVTDPFEPGSTFKMVMAAAALEEGVARPGDLVFAENGRITIARTTIHDWKKYGWLTFAEVLERSSNVGTIKVALALGPERFHHYVTAFGFGASTEVGLPGESRGIVRDPERWSALSLPTMSIGQEVSVTALQLAAAFGAVANGGTLMRPRLIHSIVDAEGRETRRFAPAAVRQVISPATAATLTRILTGVVASGTGHNAAIPGYDVAGKTGTAQKLDPETRRYSRAPGVLSFVGFAPTQAPRFVMFVMLDEPQTERWGSEAAAPIFSAVGREILRYLEVAPRDVPPVQIVTEPGAEPVPPPSVRLVSTGTPPAAGLVPDLRGRPLRRALEALAPLGVAVEVRGRGLVVQQSPAAGVAVEPGMRVRLALAAPTRAARGSAGEPGRGEPCRSPCR